ncbi:hypothetical protein SAMN05428974_2133 [Sphingopyxis sp. YR583]|jgi:hypothetical protein|uniref:hypothetical protein n=1 Tax=Sphingopyxis sp. YR583 TaxID=1881047 RepID=UPI0008A76520|nr:hypothetical protein [Sphingopyxis sp. YR583]SEH17300.1 hypothetical protein SAMN05428974_2133 [Sphingopyxis sp. YR583]
MRKPHSLRRIFAVPLTLALLSVGGLVIALTGDGWRDGAAWLALGVPVLAVGWAMKTRRR